MGCTYYNTSFGPDGGKCILFDPEEDHPDDRPGGCGRQGWCDVIDDPDPSRGCDSYESDYTCSVCGVDLNIDDCTCDDEDAQEDQLPSYSPTLVNGGCQASPTPSQTPWNTGDGFRGWTTLW